MHQTSEYPTTLKKKKNTDRLKSTDRPQHSSDGWETSIPHCLQ
jgi:hypothetical protein